MFYHYSSLCAALNVVFEFSTFRISAGGNLTWHWIWLVFSWIKCGGDGCDDPLSEWDCERKTTIHTRTYSHIHKHTQAHTHTMQMNSTPSTGCCHYDNIRMSCGSLKAPVTAGSGWNDVPCLVHRRNSIFPVLYPNTTFSNSLWLSAILTMIEYSCFNRKNMQFWNFAFIRKNMLFVCNVAPVHGE